MDEIELGPYLKELRLKKKLSIRKLEELSGVSNSYISQMEKGERRPSPEVLYKLTNPLGVSHVHLMIKAGHMKGKEEDYLQSEYEDLLGSQLKDELEKESRKLEFIKSDLNNIVLNPEVHYQGNDLSKDERRRIINMLENMFPDKKPIKYKED